MIQLSEKQAEIVNFPIGSAIQVIATAGTGKTRVLTERIRFILNQTKKDKIIALTFTNKAAEEMQNRLANIPEVQDRVWIATIHSVAQGILEKYGHLIGLPKDLHIYENDRDRMEMFIKSLREGGIDIDKYLNIENKDERKKVDKILKDYMSAFSKIKRENLSESDVIKEYNNKTVWKKFKDYQVALLESNGIDYDDIIIYAQQILLENPNVARNYRVQYKHICVDEAQDLNKSQYSFIKTFCGDVIKSLLMVGDPDQMIYGFNSSSEKFLCEDFIIDFSPDKFHLKENYRCTKAVVEVANILKPNKQLSSDYALEGKVCIIGYQSEEDEALGVVNKIKEIMLDNQTNEIEGGVSLDKIIIIGRTKFVLDKVAEALSEDNLPYYFKKSERNVEKLSRFGKVLDYAINIKLNPKNWIDAQKLSNTLDIEIEKKEEFTLDDFIQKLAEENIEQVLFKELLTKVNELNPSEPNIPKLVRDMNEYLGNMANDGNKEMSEQDEYLISNSKELDSLNRRWTRFKRQGLGNSLSAFKNAISLGKLNDDSNEQGITLSTVHTMKGLEKDIVFLISMCEGVFPYYLANTSEEIEEEKNNAFVAITRAKRWLFISYPKTRKMPWGNIKRQTMSRFLNDMKSINCTICMIHRDRFETIPNSV